MAQSPRDVQAAAPAKEKLPEGHATHVNEPAAAYVPASHTLHEEAPAEGTLPAGQLYEIKIMPLPPDPGIAPALAAPAPPMPTPDT